tara:strand:- start:187 stop:669 length:483 start_codon:yes stop_codon:yes gene_type:complete
MEKCLKFRQSKGKNTVPLYLEEKVLKEENWPTPTANDSTGSKYQYSQGDHNKKAMKLCGAVEKHDVPQAKDKSSSGENWPTPTARCIKGGFQGGRIRDGKISMDTIDVAVQAYTPNGLLDPGRNNEALKNREQLHLNPNWVEQLMGLPVGWTQLSTEWID